MNFVKLQNTDSVQLWAQQVISMGYKHVLCTESIQCAAVGTASHQHGLQARTVYGMSGNMPKMTKLYRKHLVRVRAHRIYSN